MSVGSQRPVLDDVAAPDRIAELERRLARVEAQLGLAEQQGYSANGSAAPRGTPIESAEAVPRPPEEFEFALGQDWFARVGVFTLAVGGGFLLSLPHQGVPAAVPSLLGLVGAAVLAYLTRISARSFGLLSRYLRGAAMALFYCSLLRLFFFGTEPALSTGSYVGRALLVAAVGINFVFAIRRGSPWLTGLAFLCGCTTVVAVRSEWFSLAGLLVLALVTARIAHRRGWPAVNLVATVLSYVTYLGWALHNAPPSGTRIALAPVEAPAFVLALALTFATAPFRGSNADADTPAASAAALVNCVLGYGVFLLHSWAALGTAFGPAQGAASMLFLGIAVLYWSRCDSRLTTFFYAMTGYVALSAAIMKLTAMPDVFVWLSVQSLLVIATAIWFRSRFIVVANFAIYVGIVLAYMVVKQSETGISIGFGIVALLSARLLNWQQHRLELKTELMRNAYLGSAFVVFPYALYHLVTLRWVALAWLGLALAYYVLSFVFRNPKYRWMAHGTLLGTTIYLAVIGSRQFEPAYRVASFLALGTVLVVVSLIFTRSRHRTTPSS